MLHQNGVGRSHRSGNFFAVSIRLLLGYFFSRTVAPALTAVHLLHGAINLHPLFLIGLIFQLLLVH